MLTTRIVPCLDVRDGRVVKGVRFANLRDAGDPAELARRYEEEGADELVVLDVAATPRGRETSLATVRAVRSAISIPLTVGGGVREADDAARLLEAGADKVGVNSAAVARPELLTELAERFGRQCTVLALDATRCALEPSWEVVVQSGRTLTGRDALAWAGDAVQLGAGEILLTSLDRDGTRSGYDLALLRAMRGVVDVPIVASGGASDWKDLFDAATAGADALLAASIFHDGETTPDSLKQALSEAGLAVRQTMRQANRLEVVS